MAAFDTNRTIPFLSAGRVSHVVFDAVARVFAWNDARATRKALSALSARQLDDIGLCYGDIDRIAKTTR